MRAPKRVLTDSPQPYPESQPWSEAVDGAWRAQDGLQSCGTSGWGSLPRLRRFLPPYSLHQLGMQRNVGALRREHRLRSPFGFRGFWQVGGTQEDGAFMTSPLAFRNGAALVPGNWKVARRDGLALWASVPALWLGNLVGQWD